MRVCHPAAYPASRLACTPECCVSLQACLGQPDHSTSSGARARQERTHNPCQFDAGKGLPVCECGSGPAHLHSQLAAHPAEPVLLALLREAGDHRPHQLRPIRAGHLPCSICGKVRPPQNYTANKCLMHFIHSTFEEQLPWAGPHREVCVAAAQVLRREAHQVPHSILVPAPASNPLVSEQSALM